MHRVHFDKNVTPEDLLNGVEFSIDPNENDSDEEFYDERFDEFKDSHNESNIKTSELNIPFSELEPNMEPVTEDGGVKKQVLKQGVGIKIPEKSVIIMHYDAFLDKQKVPFDSTRLRNHPYKFLIGHGNIVPGLEFGIQTMKKEEIARILISPEYGFREMGCPPRIPGNAKILYVVEIINFFESKDAVEFEEMTPDEQKKAPFEKIVAVFHCEHQIANDMFRSKLYKPAIARYKKMVKLLEDISVANEEEDEQRNCYLIKLYLNLCLCYINIRNSTKAIIYGKLGLKLDEKNPKAMYRLGCALLLADEYDEAKRYLLQARRHKPFQSCVQKTLITLEQKRKQHEEWERVCYRRMFQNNASKNVITFYSEEAKEFRDILQQQFQKFLTEEEKELPFSAGYSEWQIDIVKELASEFDFAFVSKIYCDQKIIKVVKKEKPT